jgi:hypothetical protein
MKGIAELWAAICCMFLLTTFTLVSCKPSAEKSAEKVMENTLERSTGKESDIEIDENKVTFESDEVKAVINSDAKVWPEDAPVEVPKFAWGTIINTTTTDMGESKNWGVHFKDVPTEALNKYDAELKKAGFETSRFTMNKGGNVTGHKGHLIVTVNVGEGNGHVGIQQEL